MWVARASAYLVGGVVAVVGGRAGLGRRCIVLVIGAGIAVVILIVGRLFKVSGELAQEGYQIRIWQILPLLLLLLLLW